MATKDDFYSVLTAAINDLVEHGFDSVERVARWTRELRAAAERSLISPKSLEDMLWEGLAATYRRMIDEGGILKFNEGVPLFTIDRIKPALRAELDRRIMASADLIKLNRVQAVDKTIQRLQGWATSIPKGGTATDDKRETKANIRKSLTQLPFEERRVIIDQSHKLVASISEIVANDGGAIAGEWHSHWRQPGYNYRDDHKDRDEKIYLVRDSWAHAAGYVKKGLAGYYDQVTAVAVEPFCRCYMRWIYALRDLPAEMLTAKGRAALAGARGGARADSTGRAGHGARRETSAAEVRGLKEGVVDAQENGGGARGIADSTEDGLVSQAVANYGNRPNGQERCSQCTMFRPPEGCSYVEGIILPDGWCRFFDAGKGMVVTPTPRRGYIIDRDHDVAWMAVISQDARQLYVDRTIPRWVSIDGVTFDPAELLWAHEFAEWKFLLGLLAAFLEKFLRQPSEVERIAMYYRAHREAGIPAERAEAKRLKVNWDGWEAWSRGELARLEHRKIKRPPPDPHVKPAPHDRREPMEDVA